MSRSILAMLLAAASSRAAAYLLECGVRAPHWTFQVEYRNAAAHDAWLDRPAVLHVVGHSSFYITPAAYMESFCRDAQEPGGVKLTLIGDLRDLGLDGDELELTVERCVEQMAETTRPLLLRPSVDARGKLSQFGPRLFRRSW